MNQANGSRGGQRLYSEGVMFNAMLAPLSLGVAKDYKGKMDMFYNIYDHDPLVNRTADSLLINSVSHSKTRGQRGNQCMVSSGINDVYHRVREKLKVKHATDFNFKDGTWTTPGKEHELMHKAKRFFYEQCHFVGFARGEVKYPLEDKDKFREGQVAVNCGGNVTIKADEPIATGDYVVIDFESDLLFESEDKFKQIINSKRHSLKVKSFTKSAKEAIHAALEMKKAVPAMTAETIRDAFSKGAAQVIGQCKSGCLLSNEMIDVKLDVKINKRSYDLLAMLDNVTKESIDELKATASGVGNAESLVKNAHELEREANLVHADTLRLIEKANNLRSAIDLFPPDGFPGEKDEMETRWRDFDEQVKKKQNEADMAKKLANEARRKADLATGGSEVEALRVKAERLAMMAQQQALDATNLIQIATEAEEARKVEELNLTQLRIGTNEYKETEANIAEKRKQAQDAAAAAENAKAVAERAEAKARDARVEYNAARAGADASFGEDLLTHLQLRAEWLHHIANGIQDEHERITMRVSAAYDRLQTKLQQDEFDELQAEFANLEKELDSINERLESALVAEEDAKRRLSSAMYVLRNDAPREFEMRRWSTFFEKEGKRNDKTNKPFVAPPISSSVSDEQPFSEKEPYMERMSTAIEVFSSPEPNLFLAEVRKEYSFENNKVTLMDSWNQRLSQMSPPASFEETESLFRTYSLLLTPQMWANMFPNLTVLSSKVAGKQKNNSENTNIMKRDLMALAGFTEAQAYIHVLMMEQHVEDASFVTLEQNEDTRELYRSARKPRTMGSELRDKLKAIINSDDKISLQDLREIGISKDILLTYFEFDEEKGNAKFADWDDEYDKRDMLRLSEVIDQPTGLHLDMFIKEWWYAHLDPNYLTSPRYEAYNATWRNMAKPENLEEERQMRQLSHELISSHAQTSSSKAANPTETTEDTRPPSRSAAAAAKASSKRKKGGNSKPTK